MLFKLAWHSLLDRKASFLLTLASLTLSIFIVICVEHIRTQAQTSFNRTVSGVDLIVGARTSPINLLLYSVFRIGNASNSISWESYELIASDDRVAWTIPLSLGDSHQGYRVLGTTEDLFKHFRYSTARQLEFSQGQGFESDFSAVIGSEVARELGYQAGDEITLSHGVGEISFVSHDDHPFTISGILSPTGTPVDQTVHITLAGLESVHENMQPNQQESHAHDHHDHADGETHPQQLTAMMIGLDSRLSVFALQRAINEFPDEALLAILPGVALAELWEMMTTVENLLALISVLVLLASLLGLSTMLLSSMRERQREIFLFRSVGMHSLSILFLIELEALFTTVCAIVSAVLMAMICLWVSQDWLSQEYGLFINTIPLNPLIITYLLMIIGVAMLLSLLPAVSAYRSALGTSLKT